MSPSTHQRICAEIQERHQRTIDELRAALKATESGPLSDEAFDLAQSEIKKLRAELAVWIRRADKTWYEKVYTDEIATLKAKLAALHAQEPVMIYEGRCIFDCGDGGHHDVTMLKMIPKGAKLYRAAGAALVQQKPVAEVLLVDGEKVIDASMAFFDSVELGTKLYLAAGAAPANEWKDAVLDALANHAMDAPLTDTPREIVKKLTDMVATMARDPAINAGAAPAAKVLEGW